MKRNIQVLLVVSTLICTPMFLVQSMDAAITDTSTTSNPSVVDSTVNTYELPNEMAEHVKADYRNMCSKGRKLYELSCQSCHSKWVNGVERVPDFTAEQLEAYQIRAANATHETEVSEEKVSAEDLMYIMTYLTYKKRNTGNP